MKFAVVQFPGSNCDQDAVDALRTIDGAIADLVWHKQESLEGYDAIILPGGFSYGDYLRCGAIARFSPVMNAVKTAAEQGRLVVGICNGFQILCEAGLLPGALVRNRDLNFICRHVNVRVETSESPFTGELRTGAVVSIPIAHGEGCYVADDATLRELNHQRRVLLRYSTADARLSAASNPNGSVESIAGICNARRNVFGLMPHPERACDARLGSADGRAFFESLIIWSQSRRKVA
jgi:phosphoribosylformylglycinamidine synthase